MIRCKKCNQDKPPTEFFKSRGRIVYECKPCTRARTRKWQADHYQKHPRPSVLERIEQYTIPVTESGCLLWEGAYDKAGYGRIFYKGKSRKVTRVFYKAMHGPVSDDLCLCHRCDVPACVNIEHLFLGTQADNMRDASEKGRLGRKMVKP